MLEDETTVPALFAAAVAAHGDADAIDDAATRATTYSELASAVAAAAARLSSALGAAAEPAERAVLLLVDEGAAMVALMLACAHVAGVFFVPADAAAPSARLGFVLADCRAAAIVGAEAQLLRVEEVRKRVKGDVWTTNLIIAMATA